MSRNATGSFRDSSGTIHHVPLTIKYRFVVDGRPLGDWSRRELLKFRLRTLAGQIACLVGRHRWYASPFPDQPNVSYCLRTMSHMRRTR